jgi:hypothetical protein
MNFILTVDFLIHLIPVAMLVHGLYVDPDRALQGVLARGDATRMSDSAIHVCGIMAVTATALAANLLAAWLTIAVLKKDHVRRYYYHQTKRRP